MLFDTLGRRLNYLRISITDRCNLRCLYCLPEEGVQLFPHAEILTYEEIHRVARVAVSLGIDRLRLTGGEPFIRRDFLAFLGMLREECPDMDVRVTTNGTLLGGKIPALKHLGVRRLNISLDSPDPAAFARVTGRDLCDRVLGAVDDCLRYGIAVKLNAVALRGVTEEALPAFLDMARAMPVEVRFIELMPMGGELDWDQASFLSAEEVLEAAGRTAVLTPADAEPGGRGPARVFAVAGGRGRIGVISPVSDHFCASCNRLRITSDGKLRTCLFSEREYRLRPILRSPRLGPEALERVLWRALAEKPIGHELLAERIRAAKTLKSRGMTAIGG